MKLLVFGSGRGSNFQAIHKSILDGTLKATIAAVISDVPEAAILEYAREHNIPEFAIDKAGLERDDHEMKVMETVQQIEYDLVILAGYMRILSVVFINSLEKPILNIHPSLLPSFKGLHAQKQALEAGVKVSGCTVHLVNEVLDGGKILDQVCVRVEEYDTVTTLSDRILVQEHILYSRVVQDIIDGKILL